LLLALWGMLKNSTRDKQSTEEFHA
jgi:hypothetical protein